MNKKRFEKFQAFLSNKIDRTSNSFRYSFATHVLDTYLKRPGMTNAKIWYGTANPPCDPVSAKGIAIQFKTTQSVPIKPFVSLKQSGHSTYLDSKGSIVEYVPVSKYLNVLEMDSDTSLVTSGNFNAIVNADPNSTSRDWTSAFKGSSIASSNWDMQISDLGYPQDFPNVVDWSKVTDIIIYIEALSFGS